MSEFQPGWQYRSHMSDFEVRSDGNYYRVEGVLFPFNTAVRINPWLVEEFTPDCADHQLRAAHRIWYAKDHVPLGGQAVGALTRMSGSKNENAMVIEARISKTPVGEELATLIKDKVYRHHSVGFRISMTRDMKPQGFFVDYDRAEEWDGTPVTVRTRIDIFEAASVLEGAYGELAVIDGVRRLVTEGTLMRQASAAADGMVLRSGEHVDPPDTEAERARYVAARAEHTANQAQLLETQAWLSKASRLREKIPAGLRIEEGQQ